jgi:hypothetical protein
MCKPFLQIFSLSILASLFSSQDGAAQETTLKVGDVTIVCFYPTGRPVTWHSDPSLNDVGYTKPDGIYYNPSVLSRMSEDLELFWLGHECGHATIPTVVEENADCWSAKTGVQQGWFSPADADQLAEDMKNNPGDNSHPPGPQRVANVRACMQSVSSDVSRHRTGVSGSMPVPNDPTKNNLDPATMCQTLAAIVEAASDNFSAIAGIQRTPRSSFATVKLPLATGCFIENTAQASYKCSFSGVYYDVLIKSVMACYPKATKSDGSELTNIRLDASGSKQRLTIYKDNETTLEMFATK